MDVVVRNAELDAGICDVTVRGCHTVLIDGVYADPAAQVTLDAHGAALLPGLHDHHLHLLAMAADSVDCTRASTPAELATLLQRAPGTWVRAARYHESIAGDLDRFTLDRLHADRPVRVQHRSGALWMLNTTAINEVISILDHSADVERDEHGEPTGRLWRYDARLRPALPPVEPNLARVGDQLLRLGVTGVTDATPTLEPSAIRLLTDARQSHILPQDLTLLGLPDRVTSPGPGVVPGPAKILLRDHDLPEPDAVASWISARHAIGRPVAVHCVTSDSLAIVLAAFEATSTLPGDRLEHAAVVPPGLRDDLARLRLRVVTNPGFLYTRGDSYALEVSLGELPFLYPYRSLVKAGLPVAAASDAPFGDPDPWAVIRTAVSRTSTGGRAVSPEESVTAATALAGYLSHPATPGDPPTPLLPGRYGGLCLLRTPLAEALDTPDAGLVRLVAAGGRIESISRAARDRRSAPKTQPSAMRGDDLD